MKFQGIPKATFYLHLKECEFQFNYRNQNIYKLVLEILRKNPFQNEIHRKIQFRFFTLFITISRFYIIIRNTSII